MTDSVAEYEALRKLIKTTGLKNDTMAQFQY